jgi:adenine-specific DNA-methyltransferase
MRRFSAKEETRRLVASPLLRRQLPNGHFGLENHLNFIHRPSGALSEEEVMILTELLNSELYDRYFRIMNGNTQVSSTEIRELPLPRLLPVHPAPQPELPFA